MADLIDVASKEIGYKESGDNKTKFGAFTGTNGMAWCHAFVSWCANKAKIGTNIVPKTASTTVGMNWYKNKGRFGYKGKYTPKRNDLIYFKTGASHVGIVEKVSGGMVYTIEGNSSNKVQRKSYSLNYKTITGYGKVNAYISNSNADNSSATKKKSTKNTNSGKEELNIVRTVLAKNKSTTKTTKQTFEIAGVKSTSKLEIILFFTHKKKRWNLPVKDGMKVTWERKGAPGKLEFTTLADTKHKIYNGDAVNLIVNGVTFFYGYVFALKPTPDGELSVTVYDQLRYFKNKDSMFYKKKTATKVLRKIANNYKLKTGKLANTKRQVSRNEQGKTLFDIMENNLSETLTMTGNMYTLYDEYGKLRLRQPWKVNVLLCEETAQEYEYSNSIDGDTYNQIKLAYENKDKGTLDTYIAKSSKSINKWGVLQMYEKVDSNNKSLNKLKGKIYLKMYNKQARTLSVSGAFGSPKVRAGCVVPVVLKLYDKKISSYMLVDRVVHTFSNGEHLMDLDLSGGDFYGSE